MKLLNILSLATAIVMLLAVVVLVGSMHLQVQEVVVRLEIGEVRKAARQTQDIDFGTLDVGGETDKIMVMTNNHRKELVLEYEIEGNVSKYIELPQVQRIGIGEVKEIIIKARLPDDAVKGKYGGLLRVKLRRY